MPGPRAVLWPKAGRSRVSGPGLRSAMRVRLSGRLHVTQSFSRPWARVNFSIGVRTVPLWRPGLAQSVLPSSYRDLLEVLVDAGRPLRAGRIAAAAGLSTDKSKIEGLRSKLKRLVERGWLAEGGPGLFMLPRGDAQDASHLPPEGGQMGSSS